MIEVDGVRVVNSSIEYHQCPIDVRKHSGVEVDVNYKASAFGRHRDKSNYGTEQTFMVLILFVRGTVKKHKFNSPLVSGPRKFA